MLALDMESDEAMSRVRRSAARQDVVSALADGIWMSQKELSYMTGASDAALRDMVKKGILRARYEERMRAPDFPMCRARRSLCSPRSSRRHMTAWPRSWMSRRHRPRCCSA